MKIEQLDEEIGDLKAMLVLDYILTEQGPAMTVISSLARGRSTASRVVARSSPHGRG